MSAGQFTPFPQAEDDRLADDRHAGRMARWAEPSATVAGFAFEGAGSRRRVKVANADATHAGALLAADYSKLAAMTGTFTSADRTKLDALYQALPGCRAYNNAAQTIADATLVPHLLNSERWDTHGFHDLVTNTSRLTIPSGLPGQYLVGFSLRWAAGAAANDCLGAILVNGATRWAENRVSATAASAPGNTGSAVLQLVAGDYVELTCFHNTGAPRNTVSSGNLSPELWIIRLSE